MTRLRGRAALRLAAAAVGLRLSAATGAVRWSAGAAAGLRLLPLPGAGRRGAAAASAHRPAVSAGTPATATMAVAAAAAALAILAAGCGPSAPRRLVRLGELVAVPRSAPVALPTGKASAGRPYRADPDLSAVRVGRLRLTARGDARLATLAWKLAGDRGGFPAFRSLSFPLIPDGRRQVYEIDLQREPYWSGRVETLRLAVEGGRLEVLALSGEPPGDAYRSMSLRGDTLPSLPGVRRLEIALPELPRGAWLETHLGLAPEYDKPEARAAFTIWHQEAAAGGGRTLWLHEEIAGAGGEGSGWRFVRRELPAGGGGRLLLEVEARRGGEALPEGAALWGDPVLVLPGRAAGPNLIVVLVDTLRADVLGSYGDRSGLTPNLDGFARQAVRFDELLAPSSWTVPSVTSLLTGLQPQTHGAGQRFGNFAPTGLPGGARTLASTLAAHGFYTMGVYHNIYVNPAFGLQVGFDEYRSREERAHQLVDLALDRLRRTSGDRRTFLYLHLFDAHTPYDPPPPECPQVARRFAPGYRGPLGCLGDRRPESPLPPPADRAWMLGLYRAEVAYIDRELGRLLAGLRRLGLADHTVIAIVSDHGEEFWTRFDRERAYGYESNADHGHTFYQELVRVPAMLRVPGRPARVIRGPAEMADLFPTLLRAVGVEPPPSQGVDLTPRLDGHPAEVRTLIADLVLHGPPRWSVRRGPWKLVAPREADLPAELYNLERDPGERVNLVQREPAVAASLRALGEREIAARQRQRASFFAGRDSVGATYLEWNHITKLRALGYLR
jgi:arylsulfatase A-like enzyme